MSINLNSYPYYDDFDASNDYIKILFNPARPVQARELTQIQSLLQNQIKMGSDFIFKNGSVVIPGHLYFDDKVQFIKIETIYNNINIESYLKSIVGTQIKGITTGITASIISYDIATNTDPTTLYIKYTSANGTVNKFIFGETFTSVTTPTIIGAIQSVASYTGNAAICSISDGVFYINGYFVGVAAQTITVSKYSNTESSVVGLDYKESIITSSNDPSLNDNARGFSNYNAPGADRLQASITLTVKPFGYQSVTSNASEINFISLLTIEAGEIRQLNDSTQFSKIQDWIAERTFVESGNFVTSPFTFKASNYRSNDVGLWTAGHPYLQGDIVNNSSGVFYIALMNGYAGSNQPIQPFGNFNDGVINWTQIPNKKEFLNNGSKLITSTAIQDHIAAEANMTFITSPGKAFVNGFEETFQVSSLAIVPKARSVTQLSAAQLSAQTGFYVLVHNLLGIPNFTDNLTKVNITSSISEGIMGTAYVKSIESYIQDTSSVKYKVFLFDIEMVPGHDFIRSAHSLSNSDFSATMDYSISNLSGTVSSSGTIVTGINTSFLSDLSVNDTVLIGQSTGATVSRIISDTVFYATFYVSTSISDNTDTSIGKYSATAIKLGDYIVPLQHKAINSLRDIDGKIDTNYTVSRTISFHSPDTGVTLSALSGNEIYSGLTDRYFVADITAGGARIPAVISVTAPLLSPGNPPSNNLATITGLTAGHYYKAVILISKYGNYAKEKTKTLSTNVITLRSSTPTIILPNTDVVKIIKITESGNSSDLVNYSSSGEVDITRFFTLNTGQKSEYYDLGSISSTRANLLPIRIIYDYFDHSSGDYFSSDSYSSIPKAFIGNTLINNTLYYLPDYLDFRPSIQTNGLGFDSLLGASLTEPLYTNDIFSGSTISPSPYTISTSYSFFNDRVDVSGISSDVGMIYNIGSNSMSNGMMLSNIAVNAYTNDPSKDVKITSVQVKTYTMANIQSIDSRVQNVEYYVALDQIQKDTINTPILDSMGLPVTKNGFLVDGFNDYDVSDVHNPDWKAAFDLSSGICTALQSADNVILIESPATSIYSRLASGYQLTDSLITLPYTEIPLISQTASTTAVFINQFSGIDYNGVVTLYPSMDSHTDNATSILINNVDVAPLNQQQFIYETTTTPYIPPAVVSNNLLNSAVSNISNNLLNSAVSNISNNLLDSAGNIISSIGNAASGIIGSVGNAVSGIIGSIGKIFGW